MKIRIAAVIVSLVTIASVGTLNIASAASGPVDTVTDNRGASVAPTTPAVETPATDEAAVRAIVSKPEPAKAAPAVEAPAQSAPAHSASSPAVVESAPVAKSGTCN